MGKIVFPPAVRAYIAEHYIGTGHQAMADMLNRTFGANYTKAQIKSYYGNNRLNCGITGRFRKGMVPHNKGAKGFCPAGSEKGWFAKGTMPPQHRPVGSVRIDGRNGITMVKIAEPNVWIAKHKLIWEQAYGSVPEGHVVTFLDGNKANFALNNLAAISREESLKINCAGLRCVKSDLTRAGILIAKIEIAGKKHECKRRNR